MQWEHKLFEGCVVTQHPVQSEKKENTIEYIYKYPSTFQPINHMDLFLYPELPQTNFLPSYFIVTFTTPQGTQYGHTLRTEKGTICLVSFYCWEDFFRKLVIHSEEYCWKENFNEFEEYWKKSIELPYPDIPVNTTLQMEVHILIEKLLLSQIILLFNSLICERRIVVIGNNYEKVTTFILSSVELLEPLCWPHPIITLLPQCYNELLDLPAPFICGMSSEVFNQITLTNKVIVVDLDNGTTRSNDPQMIQHDLDLFPEFATSFFRESLKSVQMEEPSQIPIVLKQTCTQYIYKLLQAPETFITVRKKRQQLVADMDMNKYKKTYSYKVGSRKFIDFFTKTGAFDQYLQKKETEILNKGGQVVEKPEPTFWESLFQINYPTNDLTKKRNEQYKYY